MAKAKNFRKKAGKMLASLTAISGFCMRACPAFSSLATGNLVLKPSTFTESEYYSLLDDPDISWDLSYDSINFMHLKETGIVTPEKLEIRANADETVALDISSDLSLENTEEDDTVVIETLVQPTAEALEATTLSSNTTHIPIHLEEWEINLVVQMVLHELGSDPKFFPGQDFDRIQMCQIRVIVNRVGKNGWKNMKEILLAPKQFVSSLDEISSFDAYEPRTRANVLKVLNGEDDISESMLCSMAWPYDMPLSTAIAKQQKLAGYNFSSYEVYYANYGSFRSLCIFGCK